MTIGEIKIKALEYEAFSNSQEVRDLASFVRRLCDEITDLRQEMFTKLDNPEYVTTREEIAAR